MADEPDDAAPPADEATHEAAHEGGKGGKLHGLLHGPHSTEILVLCSVVTVVLGYLTFRGKTSSASASAAGAGATTAVSPAGVSAGDVAGFDQAAVQGLSQQIQMQQSMLQTLVNGATATPTPATPTSLHTPTAHTLFAPSFSGNYVRYANGAIAEVEHDGSLLGLTPSEWAAARSHKGYTLDQLPGSAPAVSTVAGNLRGAATAPPPTPTPVSTQ